MTNPTVTLTSYNHGDDCTEDDFDDWTYFVDRHIDERTGFDVAVDSARFGEPGDDVVSGATDEQEETIHAAIAELWIDWCAASSDLEAVS